MKYFFQIVILLLLPFFLFESCTKDPEIITNTIVKHDTVTVTIHDTLVVHDTLLIENMVFDTATYFFVVRHAEKGSGGSNPSLTTEGQERANELSRILANINLNAVFSTNYKRTKETAEPTAASQNVAVETYSSINHLIQSVLGNDLYQKVLVVGHSNTTPDIVNQLIGENIYSDLGEDEFDNLFMVAYYDENRSEVFLMKYGD